MKLMQCGDDGMSSDVRLVARLRRLGARATFNLNAGLHALQRCFGRRHQDTEVCGSAATSFARCMRASAWPITR